MSTDYAERLPELPAILVSPNRELGDRLRESLKKSQAFRLIEDLDAYPSLKAIDQLAGEGRARVVLLDVESDLDGACEIVRFLASFRPETRVIALHSHKDAQVIVRTLRLGAWDFFHAPFDPTAQKEAAARLRRLDEGRADTQDALGQVIAFSSTKPGSGATTLAVETAFALKRLTGKRVLLADFNLLGGGVGAVLKLNHPVSILDALEHATDMDPIRWSSLTVNSGGVDVLAAPDRPFDGKVEAVRFHNLLEYARLLYDWVVVDLPAVFERGSRMVLAEANRAFLVTTPELPSLYLARKAVHLLTSVGFGRERYHVLVNRTHARNQLGSASMEKVFECPVHTAFPNDYFSLHRAASAGKPLGTDCDLGRAFEVLARRISGPPAGTSNPEQAPRAEPALAGA